MNQKQDSKAFTTEPPYYIKRGNKTIRARCIEYIDTLRIKHFKELPLETAKDLFSQIIDHWDIITIQKYFGIQAHKTISEQFIRKQYSSGTVINHTRQITRNTKRKIGYLEKLGLVHYEQRGPTVFLVVENCPITPELMKVGKQSKDNLYMT